MGNNKTNSFLEDADGNKSSKRLFASILIPIGILMAVIAYTIALFHPLGDASSVIKIIGLILGLGGGLDGLGVFDTIFSKERKHL